jgi:hypothetical protein
MQFLAGAWGEYAYLAQTFRFLPAQPTTAKTGKIEKKLPFGTLANRKE